MPVATVDDAKDDDMIELATVSDVIDWPFDRVTSLFVVALEDEMVFVSRLELWTVVGWIVDDEVISIRVVDVLNWLLVACSDIVVSDRIAEDVDGYNELLPVVIDVIRFELWSEIDDNVLVSVIIICVDDEDGTEEPSVELEIPFITVVAGSVSDADVAISMEVAYECDLDDNDEYSFEIDALSVPVIVFSLELLEIPFVVEEINWVVDSCDSTDEVRSLWEVNGAVNVSFSDEIGSLFTVVPGAVENVVVCWIVESV